MERSYTVLLHNEQIGNTVFDNNNICNDILVTFVTISITITVNCRIYTIRKESNK